MTQAEIATVLPRREAPWCGIGVRGEWRDYRDALHEAELDFRVESRDALVEMDRPGGYFVKTEYEPVPNVAVNVRVEDQKILGCVSSQYGIVQNAEAFKLLEPFTDAGGVITNAGMTEQGLVFMVLRMRREFMLGDEWHFDVMCTNSFNGAFPCAIMMVPTRIICQNMYRKLMGRSSDMLLHVRHGRLALDRIEAAGKATGNILQYMQKFKGALEAGNENPMSWHEVKTDVLPMLFPYPKPGGEREVTCREKVDAMREEFMDRYYDAEDNRKFHGSALGFLNAYYDYLSHRNPTKCMPGSWEDRRLSGLVSGNDIKTAVIKKALR